MKISVTGGILLFLLSYCIGIPGLLLLGGLGNGLVTSFNKYNSGIILFALTNIIFGLLGNLWINLCIMAFLFVKYNDNISKWYQLIRNNMNNIIKLSELNSKMETRGLSNTDNTDIEFIKYSNSKVEYVENKLSVLHNKYNEIKQNTINKYTVLTESYLFNNVLFAINKFDDFVVIFMTLMWRNLMLLLDVVMRIPIINNYFNKLKSYHNSANMLLTPCCENMNNISESENQNDEYNNDTISLPNSTTSDILFDPTQFEQILPENMNDANVEKLFSSLENMNKIMHLMESSMGPFLDNDQKNEMENMKSEMNILNELQKSVMLSNDNINNNESTDITSDDQKMAEVLNTITNMVNNSDPRISLKKKKNKNKKK